MRKEGIVSLWVGKIDSEEDLEIYVEIPYSEDEDDEEIHTSKFGENFKISYYDEDFIESKYCKFISKELKALLVGHSYDDIIISRFLNLCGGELLEESNAIILLYNFQYDGKVKKFDDGKIRFEYLGSVQYTKEVSL